MGVIKNQWEDLNDLAKNASDPKVRKFYWSFRLFSILAVLIGVITFGVGIASIVGGWQRILSFAVLPTVILLIVGAVALLSKND